MADEVNLPIRIVTDDAKKSLKDFESFASSSVDRMGQVFSALKGVAAAALAAVAAKEVIDFFKDAASASAKSEEEIGKLTASLKSLGQFTPSVVQDFKDFADQIENTSKFSDDAVIAQIAFVKQMGLTDDKAKELVQAAADLASITGDTLEGAVAELGKTLTGTAGALKKTIPEVASLTEKQLKAGEAIDLVSKRLSGAAKEAINTYGGSLIQLGNSQEDFLKGVGAIITQNPAFIAAIKAVTKGFNTLEQIVADNKEQLTAYAGLLVQEFVKSISLAVDAILVLTKSLQFLLTVGSSITVLVLDMVEAFLNFEVIQKVISAFGHTFEDVINAVLTGVGDLLDVFSKIPGASKALDAIGVDIEATIKSIRETTSVLTDMQDDGFDFKPALANIRDLKAGVLDFSEKSDDVVGGTVKGLQAIGSIVDQTSVEIQKSNQSLATSSKRNLSDTLSANQQQIAASVAASKAAVEANAIKEKLTEESKKFVESYFQKEKDTVDGVIASRDRDLANLKKFSEAGVIETDKAEKLRQVIVGESENKIKEIRQKTLDEFKKTVSDAASSPFSIFVDNIEFDPKAFKGFEKGIGAAFGGISEILKGQSGAENLVKGAASALGDALIPGIGGAVGEIVGVLAKGPDEVKKFIDEFVNSLPVIIENIVKSLPVLFEGLLKAGPAISRAILDSLPELIKGFVAAIPGVIDAFATQLPDLINGIIDAIPEIIDSLVDSLITKGGLIKIAVALLKALINPQLLFAIGKAIFEGFALPFKLLKLPEFKFPELPKFAFPALPTFSFPAFPALPEIKIPKIPDITIPTPPWVDDLKNFLKNLNPLSGGGGGGGFIGQVGGAISGGIKSIGSGLGFAEGGEIPQGFPNDTFPMRATSGENIINTDLSDKLASFLNSQSGGGVTDSLLAKIVNLLQQPMVVNTTAEVNQREFANIILQLNRQNSRLS